MDSQALLFIYGSDLISMFNAARTEGNKSESELISELEDYCWEQYGVAVSYGELETLLWSSLSDDYRYTYSSYNYNEGGDNDSY